MAGQEGDPRLKRGLRRDQARRERHLRGLTAELLEDNIRVTIVGPGAVDTELPDHITDEDAREGISGLMNLERLQAGGIANAIVYAVDPASAGQRQRDPHSPDPATSLGDIRSGRSVAA